MGKHREIPHLVFDIPEAHFIAGKLYRNPSLSLEALAGPVGRCGQDRTSKGYIPQPEESGQAKYSIHRSR